MFYVIHFSLTAGLAFLESIERTRTRCGYACVSNGLTEPIGLEDSMPSFFLSETCKYLYLLFDEDNFVNRGPYIFSTEGKSMIPCCRVALRNCNTVLVHSADRLHEGHPRVFKLMNRLIFAMTNDGWGTMLAKIDEENNKWHTVVLHNRDIANLLDNYL